ncbi:MAG: radical SAM protein [Armatimonadota bacterium]
MYKPKSKILPIDSGGIILSYKCNSRCRHCLYAGSPCWQEWADVCDIALIFQGLLETSSYLRGFHLAGGEPFLDFDRLLRIQRLATEFGIPIEYVETNAGWCVDEDSTQHKFELLRDAGLSSVLISCSPFHAEYIPLDRVTTAVKAAHNVFGPGGVIVWTQDFYKQIAAISQSELVSLDEYCESLGENLSKYMIRSGYSLISGGRVGYQLPQLYDLQPPESCEGEQCRLELLESGHAHFDPYGALIPAYCSGIKLGDARMLPLLMRTFDLDSLPLVRILADGGPYELYKYAVHEFGYKAVEDGYVGKCHLCVDVRKWIVARTDKFKELSPIMFYEEL